MTRLVLFDLDGTVLTSDGITPSPGRFALARAFERLHGLSGACEGLPFAGATDRALVRSVLRRAGVAEGEAVFEAVFAAYVNELEAVLASRRYVPIGEVAETVAALQAAGVGVGVATGNIRLGARLKLASAGLSTTFDLARGGFGGDADLREDIVRVAAARCGVAPGAGDRGTTLIVVGDTMHDVRAARAVGAHVVGVTGGRDGAARAELEAAGADVIVASCGDALVRAVASF
ncbi:MAG: HAD family hydrolase [Myxococcales bacterium]|nr:HAD family hydrolase [Myxococcales bacterium]